MTPVHEPVMVAEVLRLLEPGRGGLFVDCTVGFAGHTRALLEAGADRVLGFDRDPEALARAAESLAPFHDRVELIHADFRELTARLDQRGIAAIDGLLADLGVSSWQLDAPERGFSFRADGPLDMRMDTSQGATAADLLRDVREEELADLIYGFGEERFSRRIARAIVEARRTEPIVTTGRLAEIVRRAVPKRGYQRIDPATRTFQALRIWVNRELDGLDTFVRDAAQRLRPGGKSRGRRKSRRGGGRMAIISFHSLEDRIVKHTLRGLDREQGLLTVLTKRPLEAGEEETARNPRARSAKLRAAERTAVTATHKVEAQGWEGRADTMDFEYAIKMDVRNNPIVREIDRSRQRELWRSVADRRRPRRRRPLLALAALRRDPHRHRDRAHAARTAGGAGDQPPAPAADRAAVVAAPHCEARGRQAALHDGAGSAEHVDSRTGDGHAAAFVFGRGRAVTRGEQR